MLKLNPYTKTRHRNTILQQAKNHKIRMDKAAAALEAKSDQKGVEGKRPVAGNKEKKAVGDKKLKKPAVGKRLQGPRNQQLKSNPQKRNPPQRKRRLLHKLKFVYSINAKSFWTANFE